jgi:hypothetical protein
MRVSHPIFGVGTVLAERVTESGHAVMDIDFEARDCRRTILASVLKIVGTAPVAGKKKPPTRKSKSPEADALLYEAQKPAPLLDEVDSDGEAHEIDAVGAD